MTHATWVRSQAKANLRFVSRVQGHNQHYASVPPPPTLPQVHNVESHNLLEI
jgi:hypothetical protein